VTKHLIFVTTNKDTPQQEEKQFPTDGYLLLYLEEDKVKSAGDIELKALAPLFLKLAVEKFTK